MFAVALVPMLVLGYIVRMTILSNLEAAAQRQLETELMLAEEHVQAYVEEKLQVAKTVAALPGIVGMYGPNQRPILQAMAAVDPDFVSIRTLPPSGVTLVRSDDDPPTDYSDRHWFQQSMAGVDHTYQTVVARTTGKPSLTIGVRLCKALGRNWPALPKRSWLSSTPPNRCRTSTTT